MSLGENIKREREAKGMSQAQLGAAAGVSQQALAGLESGRTIRSRHLPEIAMALGIPVEQLVGGEPSPPTSRQDVPPINFGSLPRDIPVYGQAVGGSDGDFYFNGQIIDYLRRPPGIANAKDVFGLYVTGTSMWPKFEEGEPVYVSAARPAAIGDYVVIELNEPEAGIGNPGFIKRLAKRTPTKIVCEQFNPPQEVDYARDAVKAIYRVIPLIELVGI